MTHELHRIIEKAYEFQSKGLKSILATVVDLDGSSYRKPGVRMLISESGQMIGAVSGGCVERDINEQAQSVFKSGVPKIMTYDGRYRLGCEGLLYILIEPLYISSGFLKAFKANLLARKPLNISSWYEKKEGSASHYGTVISFSENQEFCLREDFIRTPSEELQVFKQHLEPCFRLYIFGAEHDAVKLCTMASLLGWEVHVVTSVKDPKTPNDFPGANSVSAQTPEMLDVNTDNDTAVVLMNHNYVQDLKYLLKLEAMAPKYIGILGSSKRRQRLMNDVFEHKTDFNHELLNHIYSPAGLHIGSITPEEIALSILSEILAIYRGLSPTSLRALNTSSA